ncbi:uncharacterized protein ppp1r3ab [Menidia menidia]
MECAGEPRLFEAGSLLAVPGLSSLDVDDDEGEVAIGIRPKSSPLPRRKSSLSDEDSEFEPPPCGSRRVSFADAKGLSLVQVKEFDTWDIPKLPGYDALERKGTDPGEYHLTPFTFSLPLSSEELLAKVQEQKIELEAIELLPGTTIVKGVIRVLNISYNKAVYIRTTLDNWSTHYDLLAEYIPGSSDGVVDCFSFKLTLVPPFGRQGVRVDFCLRYETPVGTFWANNNNRNYVLYCHHRMKEELEKTATENVNKKSCLKTVSQNVSTMENNSSEQASAQQYMETDVSDKGKEVAKKVSDGTSRKSAKEGQKLLMENKQNNSRRRQRKAARIAKVRDHFAQRDRKANDSLPEIKQPAEDVISGGNNADVRPFSEGNGGAERSEFVYEVPHNVAHEPTSQKEQGKSDLTTSAPAEGVTDIPAVLLCSADGSAQAEQPNIHQSPSTSRAAADGTAAQSGQSLASQASGFTFGTVVAPLYHQVFGVARSGGQIAGDEENPVDHGITDPLDQRGQTAQTEMKTNCCKVKEDAADDRESDRESLNSTQRSSPPEETNHTCTVQNPAEIKNEPGQISANTVKGPEPFFGDTSQRLDAANVSLDANRSNPQTLTECVFQGGAEEDKLTHGCSEPPECQQPEQTTAPVVAHVDETLAMSNRREVSGHINKEEEQLTGCDRAEVNHSDHIQSLTTSKISSPLDDDKLVQCLEDDTFTASSMSNLVSVCQPEARGLVTPGTSSETKEKAGNREGEREGVLVPQEAVTNPSGDVSPKVAESATEEGATNNIQADVFEQHKDETPLETTEHYEMEAAASKEGEDFNSAHKNEEKNWEMMVEEEESNILVYEDGIELVNAEAADSDPAGTVYIGMKNVVELVEEMFIAGGKDDTADNTLELEDEEMMREAESVEITADKDSECDCVQVTETDETVGAEEIPETDKKEQPAEAETQSEKHFAEIHEVGVGRPKVDDGEMVEAEGKTDIHLNHESKAGGEQEDQGEVNHQNKEEQDSDCNGYLVADEAGEAETTGAGSYMEMQERADEMGCCEERSGAAQNRVADGLSALVSNVLDVDKGDTREGQPPQDEAGDGKGRGQDGRLAVDEPESDGASAGSDSDDEVELYMHCLRAVAGPAPAHKDRIKGAGLTGGRRPSVSRGKPPPAPMPSIRESVDEEQHAGGGEDGAGARATDREAFGESVGLDGNVTGVSRWKETFSCSNILKALIYASLLVVFLVVAHHYDFLACLGLYLISLVWLWCQREKQTVKNNKAD